MDEEPEPRATAPEGRPPGVAHPGADDGRASAPERPGPPPPPPPPAPPPPGGDGWPVPGRWTGSEQRLDVASILGRTFDTYGREWSLFLLLALPAALASLVQALVVPAYIQGGYQGWTIAADADPQQVLQDAVLLVIVVAVGALVSGIGTLAMIVTADRMWQAQPTGLADALVGALRATPRAVALWIVLFVALVLGSMLIAISALLLTALAGVVGVLAIAALVVVMVVALVIVAVRLTPILVVLVAERTGVRASLTRTWDLTRGHAIMLFVTGFVVGLCSALGVYGSSLIASASDSSIVAGLASGLAAMIAAPLSAIWPVIAWGDLVGGRHRDSAVVARGHGRAAAVVIVAGLGTILLIVGIAMVAGSLSSQTLAS